MAEFYSIQEIAEILKMSKRSIYRLVKTKALPAYKFGKEFRVDRQDFEDFLKQRKV